MAIANPKMLFLLFSYGDVEKAIDIYGIEKLRESKCFALTVESLEGLIKNNVRALEYEIYFPEKFANKLNLAAKKWAKDWYKTGNFAAHFENIDLLALLDLTLYNYFAKKLFQYFSLRELFLREKPKKIFIGREQSGIRKIFASDYDILTPVIERAAKDLDIETKRIRGNYLSKKVFNFLPVKLLFSFLEMPSISGDHKKLPNVKYLFVGNHYHIKNILLLIKKFSKQSLVIGRMKEFRSELMRNSIRLIDVKSALDISSFITYIIYKFKFLLTLLFIDTGTLRFLFKFQAFDFFDLFKLKIYSVFVRDCSNLLVSILQAEKVLKMPGLKLLINVTEDLHIRGFISQAKKIGIPTLEIEHGFTTGYDSEFTIVDKLAVWGDEPKKIYQSTGFDKNKMVTTGWLAFEQYKSIKLTQRKIDRDKFTILFIAQDPDGASLLFLKNTPIKSFEIFFEAISNFKSAKIIVRLHPRADKRIPTVLAKKYNLKFEFSEKEELSDSLRKSEIVVSQTTSATLDALIMHKPVIYLCSMRWPSKYVEDSGAVFEVKTSKELLLAIRIIVNKRMTNGMILAQNNFVENYCNFSQNSIEQTSDLMYEIAK